MKKIKKQYSGKDIKYFCRYNKNIFNNIKEYFNYRERKKYLLKNGYSPNAIWNTDFWFIDIMSDILQKHYEWNKEFLDTKDDRNIEIQNDIESMIKHLKIMKEYDELELDDKEEKSREEFFKLFSKNFHALWN